jgi:sterol desaturase/sphingolipid hydroxylase (fatty acid hydroxylase superfamily)
MIYYNTVSTSIAHYWGLWLKNQGLTWAVGPVLCYIVGYSVTAITLECAIRTNWAKDKMITHIKGVDRDTAIQKTQAKIPFTKQLKCVLMQLFGPTAIFNGVLGYFAFQKLKINKVYPLTPTWQEGLIQFVALQLIGDFLLYWGHRIQHDIPYLWKNFHSLHHTLDTPTPIGTIYIDSVDATLQGALPLLLSTAIVRPHPLTAYAYTIWRLAENVVNHSGLESTLLNVLFLKFLPGRASVSHHDYHHKFSNYSGNAKNYAEFFWIWDYLFGTLSTPAKSD